jgi:hypothetical protein
MADDFDTGAANGEWQRLGTEAQRKWLEYRELKDSGDGYTAGIAMREALALERAQREFTADCRRKIEESQPRHQYVSQEQRAARQPHELTRAMPAVASLPRIITTCALVFLRIRQCAAGSRSKWRASVTIPKHLPHLLSQSVVE